MVNDPLDREVSLVANLSEKGVEGHFHSRAVAAIDRLVGNIMHLPNPSIEGFHERSKIKQAYKTRMLYDNLVEGGFAPDAAVCLVDDIEERSRNLSNRAGVVQETVLALEDEVKSQEKTPNDEDLDDAWLEKFKRYAGEAGEERAQRLWGRILAREISEPCSFSTQTLRLLSETDRNTAETFSKVAEIRFTPDSILSSSYLAGRELPDPLSFDEKSMLEEAGLLYNSTLSIEYKQTYSKGKNFLCRSKDYAMIGYLEEEKEIAITVEKIYSCRFGDCSDNTVDRGVRKIEDSGRLH